MASPKRRTWTLSNLDRDVVWLLWFDGAQRRWEIQPSGTIDPGAEPEPWADEPACDVEPPRLSLA